VSIGALLEVLASGSV